MLFDILTPLIGRRDQEGRLFPEPERKPLESFNSRKQNPWFFLPLAWILLPSGFGSPSFGFGNPSATREL
jgi:hypothetical protein